MPAPAQVVVARIGRPHGLRGEVTVQVHTDSPRGRFVAGASFGTEPDVGLLTLQSARVHQGVWLLAFAGRTDRDAAQALRGTRLTVDSRSPGAAGEPAVPIDVSDAARETAPVDDLAPPEQGLDLADDGWYPQELVGLSVHDLQGHRIGEVVGLELRGAQDLLEVRLDDGRTGRVPFVTALVPVVDPAGGRVVIDPPTGLFDLETG